jgi:nitroimidazol reductase NimA-like FMN-containing flavoprotein (pyridoxamine 5'-phosphate oxidase superfamily)
VATDETDRERWQIDREFDVDAFLSQPLVARVATVGPAVRPVWFLWEAGSFWWLTGPWTALAETLASNPEVALVVDTCDLSTGAVKQVVARGTAELAPFDHDRAIRKLSRYLGANVEDWDPRFRLDENRDREIRFVRLTPRTLRARDLSFEPAALPRRE